MPRKRKGKHLIECRTFLPPWIVRDMDSKERRSSVGKSEQIRRIVMEHYEGRTGE